MSLANIVTWNKSTETAVRGSHNPNAFRNAADGSIVFDLHAGPPPQGRGEEPVADAFVVPSALDVEHSGGQEDPVREERAGSGCVWGFVC